MDGFERRKQHKLELIRKAASRLFGQFGYSKVSVNEIAELAGVSPATIFNYFGTKENVYIEVLMDGLNRQVAEYEGLVRSEVTYPEKVRAIMLAEMEHLQSLYGELGPLVHRGGPEPWVTERLQALSEQKLAPLLMELVELGRQEGYIYQGYTDQLVLQYFDMYSRELNRLLSTPGTDREVLEQWISLFFNGLNGRGIKHEPD